MTARPPTLKTEQFDMETFFDFNQSSTQPSSAASASTSTPRMAGQDWTPFDKHEERQFNGPSHDYNLYKQQVGLPVGSMASVPPQNVYDGFDSGLSDMGMGWSSGIDMDADMGVDFNNPQSSIPPMFFPPPSNPSESFVDPNRIGGHEEPTSNVGRLWPGMHSQQAQQASMQKAAQAQAVHQRQMKLQAQHAQYRQAGNGSQNQGSSQQVNGHSKRPSHAAEPHVEESISRLLNQMRQNSSMSADDDDDDSRDGMLPHIARMKKDEEEMDEDERLLASEEGKKLSSKERRQLRNKVSARAFRSRRKEYISQLEGEVAMKAQENNNLRNENSALLQENDRYRTLIETLLRHPAFTPFINDISKDPSVLGPPPQQQPPQPAATPSQPPSQPHRPSMTPAPQQQGPPSESKPEFMNFDASQLQVPQSQQQEQHVGMAIVPENDFSKLNINGFNNSMNFNNYSVNAYAVTEIPQGPDPLDLLIASPIRMPVSYLDSSQSTADLDSAACNPDMTVLLAKLDGAARNVHCSR